MCCRHSWRRLEKGKDDDNGSGSIKQSSGQPDDKVAGDPGKVGSGEKFSSGDKGGSGFKGGDIHMPGDEPEKPSKKESEMNKDQGNPTPDSSKDDGSEPAPPGETDEQRMKRCKSRTNLCFLQIGGWIKKNNLHFEKKKPGEQ